MLEDDKNATEEIKEKPVALYNISMRRSSGPGIPPGFSSYREVESAGVLSAESMQECLRFASIIGLVEEACYTGQIQNVVLRIISAFPESVSDLRLYPLG